MDIGIEKLNSHKGVYKNEVSKMPYSNPTIMTCLGQTSGHRQLAAVITNSYWRLGVMSLRKRNY